MIDTRRRILDTAERLFGEQGYSTTSLRQIITTAEVNVAAVHYHFGSKEDLLDAIVLRKAGPVTAARLDLLDRAEAAAAPDPPCVDLILESFLLPTADVAQNNPAFALLMGRMLTEGMMPRIVEKHFQETAKRYVEAFARALPNLPREELLWRFHFMIGAMAHTICGSPTLRQIDSNCDFPTRMRRLVTFLAAAFRAPAENQPCDVR